MNETNILPFLLAGANIQHISIYASILFCFFLIIDTNNFNLLKTGTLKHEESLLVITLFAHNIYFRYT